MTTTIVRPPLHNRSITSPSAPASYTPQLGDSFTSDDELTEDVFSDNDDAATLAGSGSVGSGSGGGGSGSGGNPHMGGGAGAGGSGSASGDNGNFFLESMIRPVKQATRTHMRRLTGGRSREAERQRDLFRTQQLGQIGSPQVPKVPNSYLLKSPDSPGDMM
ncbi:cell morphogenesis protein-like protein PAG1 [Apiospora saccharicola]